MPFQKNEITKEKILKAALNVFARKGFAGTTIMDVASVAGVNKALIYYYFSDKETLFSLLVESQLEAIIDDFKAGFSSLSVFSLEKSVPVIRQIKEKHPVFIKLFLTELIREGETDPAGLLLSVLRKNNINLISAVNRLLSDSEIFSEISMFNREMVVILSGLFFSDILTEKLSSGLLNIREENKETFRLNIDRLISIMQFKSQ